MSTRGNKFTTIEETMSVLKVHISQENPEALDMFEKVIKRRK
jgi:hypothetical protein